MDSFFLHNLVSCKDIIWYNYVTVFLNMLIGWINKTSNNLKHMATIAFNIILAHCFPFVEELSNPPNFVFILTFTIGCV